MAEEEAEEEVTIMVLCCCWWEGLWAWTFCGGARRRRDTRLKWNMVMSSALNTHIVVVSECVIFVVIVQTTHFCWSNSPQLHGYINIKYKYII